jgi:hypothetical protein
VQTSPWEAELQAARRQAADPVFQASYRRWRPLGGTLHRLAGRWRQPGVRYRGMARNQHWLWLRVAAINLRRLVTLDLQRHHPGPVLAC